ncbi:hypothetical protein KO516_22190 [Citreicella sp. C3M06]|uniref:hypothetical protein n=1 Tax=Citreicella sp. C3M06 TaxID=2841564 RepID=UPI001C0A1F48|nr:hypothetical protein [Citreicella sp. C3M06]MBU2963487.1 hypothetical protein [Citreicella sp. C3M06]
MSRPALPHLPAPPHRIARPRLFIDAQHGLANRMRTIASAASIARQAEHDLFVVWRTDIHCGARMRDLFDYPGPVIEDGVADLCRASAAQVFNDMEVEPGSRHGAQVYPARCGGDLYIRSAYTLRSPLRRLEDEQAFLHGLRPSAAVADLVAQVPTPSAVSAHIRMASGTGHDHRPEEGPDNWPEHRHREIAEWREKSHSSRFVARIDVLLAAGKADTIFLAADLPDTYALFADRYGPRLRMLSRARFDRSEEQLQYALADLLLLTATQRLLASTWSSFSDMAQRLMRARRAIERSGLEF